MELQGKTVLVVGAGKSGMAACRYLLGHQCQVILADNKSQDVLLKNKEIAGFVKQGGQLISGHVIPEKVTWDLAVVSPGVPLHIPILNITRAAGVEIIGEIELAYSLTATPFIGVTGTNGKTTTTSMIGHILQKCGVAALVGGNIGKPLVDSVTGFKGDYIVAELSSFQLESCVTFRPHVAVYLNLTPDHLDRHGDMNGYAAAKEKMFARQSADDFAILNLDDEYVRRAAEHICARKFWFSLHLKPQNGIYFDEGALHYIVDGQEKFAFATADIFIKGMHNVQNSMAAFLAAAVIGLDPQQIAQAIYSFKGVAHRLEFVTERNGVLFINDSKGTNPASTIQAIYAYDRPMILLLGGRNKGSDFSDLMELIKSRVKQCIIYGEAAGEIKRAADEAGYASYLMANDFEHAVALAKENAQAGDVVMLSPACASWDSFANFEQRGDKFKELVK